MKSLLVFFLFLIPLLSKWDQNLFKPLDLDTMGTKDARSVSVFIDDDGNTYTVGILFETPQNTRCFINKHGSDMKLLAKYSWGSGSRDIPESISVDPQTKEVYVSGLTSGRMQGSKEFVGKKFFNAFVTKFNKNLELIWSVQKQTRSTGMGQWDNSEGKYLMYTDSMTLSFLSFTIYSYLTYVTPEGKFGNEVTLNIKGVYTVNALTIANDYIVLAGFSSVTDSSTTEARIWPVARKDLSGEIEVLVKPNVDQFDALYYEPSEKKLYVGGSDRVGNSKDMDAGFVIVDMNRRPFVMTDFVSLQRQKFHELTTGIAYNPDLKRIYLAGAAFPERSSTGSDDDFDLELQVNSDSTDAFFSSMNLDGSQSKVFDGNEENVKDLVIGLAKRPSTSDVLMTGFIQKNPFTFIYVGDKDAKPGPSTPSNSDQQQPPVNQPADSTLPNSDIKSSTQPPNQQTSTGGGWATFFLVLLIGSVIVFGVFYLKKNNHRVGDFMDRLSVPEWLRGRRIRLPNANYDYNLVHHDDLSPADETHV